MVIRNDHWDFPSFSSFIERLICRSQSAALNGFMIKTDTKLCRSISNMSHMNNFFFFFSESTLYCLFHVILLWSDMGIIGSDPSFSEVGEAFNWVGESG